MKYSSLPRPSATMRIDLNSEAAFAGQGLAARKAPRLLPVPFQTVSADPHHLTLEPWRKDLALCAQLYFVVGRDVPVGDEAAAEDAVLGIGLGLAYSDSGIVTASPDPAPRDQFMCYWYSLYSDNSQVLSDELLENVRARDITLTLESETLGRHVFPQKDLLFDPADTLREMCCIAAFRKYDLISLGAAAAPISIPADKKFLPGEKITISGGPLGVLEIAVDDRRDPSVLIPTWKPRDFFLNKEYQV